MRMLMEHIQNSNYMLSTSCALYIRSVMSIFHEKSLTAVDINT
jgi:hypothetical protein